MGIFRDIKQNQFYIFSICLDLTRQALSKHPETGIIWFPYCTFRKTKDCMTNLEYQGVDPNKKSDTHGSQSPQKRNMVMVCEYGSCWRRWYKGVIHDSAAWAQTSSQLEMQNQRNVKLHRNLEHDWKRENLVKNNGQSPWSSLVCRTEIRAVWLTLKWSLHFTSKMLIISTHYKNEKEPSKCIKHQCTRIELYIKV